MTSNYRILVVDDMLGPRESLRMILRDSYDVHMASSGREAIDRIEKGDLDLLLMDIKMPDIDGIQALKEIKKRDPHIEVIMVTAFASLETAKDAVTYGARDYIIKPFNERDIKKVVQKGIRHRAEYLDQTRLMAELKISNLGLLTEVESARRQLREHHQETLDALIVTIDIKNNYTLGHSKRVSALASVIGERLDLPQETLENLKLGGLIHDIGKLGIPGTILRKPGPLDRAEWETIRQHPAIGVRIVSQVSSFNDILPLIKHHHERYDGMGYPDHLAKDDIPHSARILIVIDAVEAMLSDRPYRKALTLEEAINELKAGMGTQFDPHIADITIEILKKDGAGK